MHFDWSAAATVIVFMLGIFFANRMDVKKRHRENMQVWRRFLFLLDEHPLHSHVEQAGGLTVEGIRFPRSKVEAGSAER
jgi:hypothetical protein